MSREKGIKQKKAVSLERVSWELQRAFSSFQRSPVFAVLLFQLLAFIVVHAKGAGKIYADMIGILVGITLISWFFVSVIHGNQKILSYSLLLLTVGTMLQCIMKQEQIVKKPELAAGANLAAGLQLQYLVAFGAAFLITFVYLKGKKLASMPVCRVLAVVSLFLSALTLVVGSGKVRNWITIGGMSLQTTEIIKVLYVFIGAILLATNDEPSPGRIKVFYGITILEALMLTMQSEFGTLLLILMIFLTFVFLFIPDMRIFIWTVGAIGVLALVVILAGIQIGRWEEAGSILGTNPLSQFFLSNYDKIANRFIYWLNPEKDALGLGYQLLKARESIVLGGWFGTSSVTDLPVKTSDLVYPALIQRCGMIFAVLVFFVFILMWLEGIKLFIRKKDRFHQAVGAGFVFMLFDQALIIIGGSTGLFPLTGITLPFISSGGSSLVVTFMITGIILAVSSNVKWKGTNNDEKEEFFKENAVFAKCNAYLRHLNDHIPYPDFRTLTRRFGGSRPAKDGGQRKNVSKRVRSWKHPGQKGKHSGHVEKTRGKKNLS